MLFLTNQHPLLCSSEHLVGLPVSFSSCDNLIILAHSFRSKRTSQFPSCLDSNVISTTLHLPTTRWAQTSAIAAQWVGSWARGIHGLHFPWCLSLASSGEDRSHESYKIRHHSLGDSPSVSGTSLLGQVRSGSGSSAFLLTRKRRCGTPAQSPGSRSPKLKPEVSWSRLRT